MRRMEISKGEILIKAIREKIANPIPITGNEISLGIDWRGNYRKSEQFLNYTDFTDRMSDDHSLQSL